MQNHYVDAHLHLQDPRFHAEEVISRATKVGVSMLFCNAIQEEDWPVIADLAVAHQEVVAFFGIHPWFSDTAAAGWQQRLLTISKTLDKAAGIGETGLDRSCPIDFSVQKRLFTEHLELAAELSWPLSVHCVRAWGALVDILADFSRQSTLPPLLIHSFNGSTEIMRRLTKLGCYLSYSEALVGSGQAKLRETFVQTPTSVLLLETDAPYAKNPDQKKKNRDAINEPADVVELYHCAARLLQIAPAQLSDQLHGNAKVFTNSNAAGQ